MNTMHCFVNYQANEIRQKYETSEMLVKLAFNIIHDCVRCLKILLIGKKRVY